MANIQTLLGRLGMSQYLVRFCAEGFDTWEAIMDITEADLASLAVAPIHRRKLQQEISEARTRLKMPWSTVPDHATLWNRDASPQEQKKKKKKKKKRAYRRHPKADTHGPKHPLSAYMLFTNEVRKNLQDQQLSFGQLARQVGESWQLLGSTELGEWKFQAAVTRELYLQDLEKYKQTEEHKEYRRYLFDFKLTSSSSHPRSGRQSTSQVASNFGDADGKITTTRRHRPSHPQPSASPSLESQHYVKAGSENEEEKPPALHGPQSTHGVLSNSPLRSDSRFLPRAHYPCSSFQPRPRSNSHPHDQISPELN